ncbi:MAG: hypothetical protein V1493_02125 [Candidatus Diapherotrites archaeon]
MPLQSVVTAVKRNPLAPKQIVYQKPAPRFIDADEFTAQKQAGSPNQPVTEAWKTCQYFKEANDKKYCIHFMSFCAMEKCNGTLPLLGQKMKRR